MANQTALQDLTWDSATCASIVLGVLRVPFMKLSPGKITIKRDKPAGIGEGLPRRRTPGRGEVGDFNGEILATDFEGSILPRLPRHGGTLLEFPILITIKHPAVPGSLGILLDDSSITELDGPELDGSEKAIVYKLQFNAMRRFDKGRDGQWKGLAYDTNRPSAQAVALMKFG